MYLFGYNELTNVFQSAKEFDTASFENEESIAKSLNTAREHPNPEMLSLIVKNISRARGMTQLARDTGLGRESLY